jgi:predicted acyl esterase
VKPVDGPDGPSLLDAAIGEHQSNTDVHALMGRVPFRDDRVAGLDWEATAPAASGPAIASSGVPMLVRAGWLDGGFAAGALARFLGSMAGLTREAGLAGTVTHRVDVTTSTGATNRWLAIDLGRAPAYPDRKHAMTRSSPSPAGRCPLMSMSSGSQS